MVCPEMSDFAAWINLMPPSSGQLIVTGKVVTTAGNKLPKLTAKTPQGINPKMLLLDLTIETTSDVGTDDVAPRDVRFEKPAGKGQYTDVEVFFGGESCLSIKVEEAH